MGDNDDMGVEEGEIPAQDAPVVDAPPPEATVEKTEEKTNTDEDLTDPMAKFGANDEDTKGGDSRKDKDRDRGDRDRDKEKDKTKNKTKDREKDKEKEKEKD